MLMVAIQDVEISTHHKFAIWLKFIRQM